MSENPYGLFIRNRRNELGLSLRQVAEAIGTSAVYLADVERGRRNSIAQRRVDSLARALEVDVSLIQGLAAEQRGHFEVPLEHVPAEHREAFARLVTKPITDERVWSVVERVVGKERA